MKIAMVTGSYPPDICGVGDYTSCLVKALEEIKCDVDVITDYKWTINEIKDLKKELSIFDIIHIQYPTVGYKYSIIPQMMSLLPNTIVTLHEISQSKYLRQLSLMPFFIFAKHLIFTNSFELDYTNRIFKFVKDKSTIIPIGSNISAVEKFSKAKNDEIVYFGLIRENKGLENVIELAKEIKEKNLNYKIQIIGKVEEKQKDYFKKLKLITKNLPVKWNVGLDENEVGKVLAEVSFAYLPFPDGASERRGSLLALLINKVVVITTYGRFTTDEMSQVVLCANSANEALNYLDILKSDINMKNKLMDEAERYMKKFSWKNIALEHKLLYEKIIKNR